MGARVEPRLEHVPRELLGECDGTLVTVPFRTLRKRSGPRYQQLFKFSRQCNVVFGFTGLCGGDYYDQARPETIVLVEDRAFIAELILGPCRAVNNYCI